MVTLRLTLQVVLDALSAYTGNRGGAPNLRS